MPPRSRGPQVDLAAVLPQASQCRGSRPPILAGTRHSTWPCARGRNVARAADGRSRSECAGVVVDPAGSRERSVCGAATPSRGAPRMERARDLGNVFVRVPVREVRPCAQRGGMCSAVCCSVTCAPSCAGPPGPALGPGVCRWRRRCELPAWLPQHSAALIRSTIARLPWHLRVLDVAQACLQLHMSMRPFDVGV